MPLIAETPSNPRCSIHNIEVILFLLLSFFTHPAERQVTCKTNNHSSNPYSLVSLLRLCLNRSLPLHASNQLALSRSLEGYTAIIDCQGEESSANRIAFDKGDGKKVTVSSNSAQVLSMPVAVVP